MKLPSERDPKARDVTYLDQYAMERWECVLHYMVIILVYSTCLFNLKLSFYIS